MENRNLQFKTNINCSGCVSKLRPLLDAEKEIYKWDVDIANKDKILTVQSDGIRQEKVVEILKSKGFSADPLMTKD